MSGCSADATRLGDPFGNPFSSASNDAPMAQRRHVAARDVIPAGRMPPVTSTALAPSAVSVASLAPSRPAFRAPVSSETTGSIDRGPTRMASGASFGGWSSAGGTPIQVADGESAEIIGKRYGVPTTALLQVNGLHSAAEVRPGTQITIPIYTASGREAVAPRMTEAAPQASAPVRKAEAVPARATTPTTHVAAVATPRAAKNMAETTPVSKASGQPSSSKTVAAKSTPVTTASLQPHPLGKLPVGKAAVAATAPQVAKAEPVAAPVPAAKAMKVATAAAAVPVAPAAAPAVDPAPAPSAAPAATAENNPEFRWPARGRIIQGFKGGSGGNDGINIAVPEGTAVKAAEGGVVAYAGSELKGYGNLVLIRHPNGYVSAYANNGEIDVKRGETVKRGQQIAKSGQSGNVSSPQLHFELRKGSTPVDPTQYLAGL